MTKSGVGQIVLNGAKNNPLDWNILNKLALAFDQSSQNEDMCVLFTATGPNFTVGADLKYIHKLINTKDAKGYREFIAAFQNLTISMVRHNGIIIVGLHGWVIGGGFEIALAADLRYATLDTRIKLPELSIGTMFSNGSTKLLSQIVGLGRAKQIMFLGEEVSPEYGYEIGLINKVCATDKLEDELRNTAEKISKKIDQKVLGLAKELLLRNYNLPIEQVLENEQGVLNRLNTHQGFMDKINDFVKK